MKIITFLSTLLLSYSTVYSSKTVLFKESIYNNTNTSFFENSIRIKNCDFSPLVLSNTPEKNKSSKNKHYHMIRLLIRYDLYILDLRVHIA